MVDKAKLARLLELKKTLEDTEAEINRLLGGEPARRGRPSKENRAPQQSETPAE